jgi:hypothetical protein
VCVGGGREVVVVSLGCLTDPTHQSVVAVRPGGGGGAALVRARGGGGGGLVS